jgi:DNA/RNA-binding domain of Phe-tRNA-synthetase-like protein
MHFCHAAEIWKDYPGLAASVLLAQGITESSSDSRIARFNAVAASRLAACPESELPEIQAWRRVFSRMGLKPTQYRCASESLLRRFRKEKCLPQIHPVIDLCNSVSMAFAVPIAVFDVSKVAGYLEVRYAAGPETYLTFSGEIENPEPREVIFADASSKAHARRWSNRQSAYSAVGNETASVLIVAEAMHSSARPDIQKLAATLAEALEGIGCIVPKIAILSSTSPRFEF